MSKKVLTWMDCDPGFDDAVAIILASMSDRLEIIGISCVGGNQRVETLTNNTLKVVNLCGHIQKEKPANVLDESNVDVKLNLEQSLSHGGMKFPILTGSSRPFLRPARVASHIHGETGLETDEPIDFPSIPEHAIEFTRRLNSQQSPHFTTRIYDYFRSLAPQKVTILATGPLTNIALLLINHPDVRNHIDRLVMMGGSIGPANYGPAEFNILVDPEAASFVFNESNLDIFMVPLDVTDTAEVVPSLMDRLDAFNTHFTRIVASWLKLAKKRTGKNKKRLGPPVHDVCAAAFAIDPSIFDYRLMRVDIETVSPLCTGQTVCDCYGYSQKAKNVHVATKMDLDKFWNMMFEAIQAADRISPANQL